MNDWEEFDVNATYQKKLVDPEMWKWVLTKGCQRIISDEFFNNLMCNQGMYSLCLVNWADCPMFSTPIGDML